MLLHVPTLAAKCHWVITAVYSPGIYGDNCGYFECFVMLQFNCILVPRILLMCIYSSVWQAWEMCVNCHSYNRNNQSLSWGYQSVLQCSGTTVGLGTAAMNLPVDLPWSLLSNHSLRTCLMYTLLVLTIIVLSLSTVVLTGCLWQSRQRFIKKLNTINCHKETSLGTHAHKTKYCSPLMKCILYNTYQVYWLD